MIGYTGVDKVSEKIDFWNMAFEQTPTVLRWVFGIFSLGFFTMLSVLYRWHRRDMERVESRIERVEGILMKVHENTSRRREDETG